MRANAQLPQFAADLFKPARYKVFFGGRGAGRSWSYARALLLKGTTDRLRILCCREFQKSIADSVHKLLKEQIEILALPFWRIQNTTITNLDTGTEFLFEGLRYNANRIKSMEGVDICWVEEAESVSRESWDILIPTIRKPGSEIWVSFNPQLATDPTYQRFVVPMLEGRPVPNAIVKKVGWEDNPWFPDELRMEKDYLYQVDPEAADHVWGGEPYRASEAQILRDKWRKEAFTPQKHWDGPFYGLDFGFAEDPTACAEIYIERMKGRYSRGRLYIYKELFKPHLDLHKTIPELQAAFGRYINQRHIPADSARPESISYLKQHGLFRITPVLKWPGSVEDGIAYLRQFEEIIIHPSCPKAIQEAALWSYKVDQKTGDVLPDVVDKHNNIWDAVRYALVHLIRAARKRVTTYTGMSYSNA